MRRRANPPPPSACAAPHLVAGCVHVAPVPVPPHVVSACVATLLVRTRARATRAVGNDIKYVPEELNKLTSLEVLYLHKNRTKFIAPEAFAGLHRLRHISIEDNKIKALPRSLSHVTSLVDLTVSHNRLEHLPAVRASVLVPQTTPAC